MKNQFIIAHRGSSYKAPENTLESVNLAWDEEADAVEVDVHSTKDKHIVVMHDPSVKRTTGRKMLLAKSNLYDLKSLDAGSWKGKDWENVRIPTLKEVFETVPQNKKIFIEIKSGLETLAGVKKLIKESSLLDKQITIMDFNLTTVMKSKKILPKIEAVWLKEFPLLKNATSIKKELSVAIDIALKNNIDGLNVENVKALDSEFISKMKNNNLRIYTWTVDNVKRASELFDWGIDGVTTNKPKEIKLGINERAL